MKNVFLFLILIFCITSGYSQGYPVNQNLGAPTTLVTSRGGFKADSSFILPAYSDTAKANANPYVKNYAGSLIKVGDALYVRSTNLSKWILVGSSSGGTFQNNIVMNATSLNRLGYWVNGETIPVAGKTLDEAFEIITKKAVPPTYTAPRAFISSAPTSGNYEIGSSFSVTLSSTFTQNDGGALTSTTYFKGAIALGSNTDAISNLTTPISYTVQKGYAQGPCKNNNLGIEDCTGRINAGTATSDPITFNPLPKRYWGVSSTFPPSSATIIAATGGNSEFATTKSKTNFIVTVTGTNLYVYYAYPSSLGDLTSIFVSGLESFNAFTKTVINVTNASGYSQNYNVYTSQNFFNNTTVTFNSVN